MQIFVNLHHQDRQDGSRAFPFATIGQAAALAKPGDEVVVFPGLYREWVRPARGGQEDAGRITYRSFLPRGAVISGAEPVTGWTLRDEAVYAASLPKEWAESPETEPLYSRPDLCRTGRLYWNGEPLQEAPSPEALLGQTNAWFCQKEEDRAVLLVRLDGRDPNGEQMELSVRPACFTQAAGQGGFLTLSGFRMEKTAPAHPLDAAVCLNGGSVLEDCEVRDSLGSCVALTGNDTAPVQVLGCEIRRCEKAGIISRTPGVSCVVKNAAVHHAGLSEGPDAGGIVLSGASHALISGCHLHHCAAGLSVRDGGEVRVYANACHHNGEDLRAEADCALIDHNLFLSPGGISVDSPGGCLCRNLADGSCRIGRSLKSKDNLFTKETDVPSGNLTPASFPDPSQLSVRVLGGEGRWVLSTNLYSLLEGLPAAPVKATSLDLPPADYFGLREEGKLPGPFADGTPGAWILGPRNLP